MRCNGFLLSPVTGENVWTLRPSLEVLRLVITTLLNETKLSPLSEPSDLDRWSANEELD